MGGQMKREVLKSGKTRIEKSDDGNEGYTFVETLAVLAICTVLTTGATISATKAINLAKRTSAKNQIEQYSAALQSYFLDCGCFPTKEQGLAALWEKPVLYPVPEKWEGPYLERKPGNDPWGTDFEYITAKSAAMPSQVPKGMPFVLISYGADGKEGGEKNNADIVSWE